MTINIDQSSENSKTLLKAVFMWGLATLFYFYDNLLQISPSAMKPELSLAFSAHAEAFGSLSAYCLYAYGLTQIPAGMLIDRFGPKRLLTFASLACALGSMLFGFSEVLWQAKVGRLLIGLGAGFALVGCLKIASLVFCETRFAFMTGLTVMVGFLGAVFGLSMVSEIVESLGWRHSMLAGGALGLAIAALLWFCIRDNYETESHPSLEAETLAMFDGLKIVISDKQTWIAAMYAGLMFVPTLAFGGLWGIPFLVEAYGFDRSSAGLCISLIYVGWIFGSPCWGYLSDHLRKRNLPMMVSTIITSILCVSIIYSHDLSLTTLRTLLFLLGFFSSGFILAFAVVRESHPNQLAGTAIGFTNALNTLWGALAQPLIGKILDLSAGEFLTEGVERVFTLEQYQRALVALPIALGISFCLLCFLKETHGHTLAKE